MACSPCCRCPTLSWACSSRGERPRPQALGLKASGLRAQASGLRAQASHITPARMQGSVQQQGHAAVGLRHQGSGSSLRAQARGSCLRPQGHVSCPHLKGPQGASGLKPQGSGHRGLKPQASGCPQSSSLRHQGSSLRAQAYGSGLRAQGASGLKPLAHAPFGLTTAPKALTSGVI
jgi:hypothetical protein